MHLRFFSGNPVLIFAEALSNFFLLSLKDATDNTFHSYSKVRQELNFHSPTFEMIHLLK